MKRRTKLMAAGSVALATGAIVSGAVVTSNAMASSEAPPPEKVTVGVVSAVSAAASPGGGDPGTAVGTDAGTVFTCEFTDVPVGTDATPVGPGGVESGAVGTDGRTMVASGSASVIAGSGTIAGVPPAGLAEGAQTMEPPPAGANVLQLPDLTEAREGTTEECAALRPASVPAPPR